jgi:hypothetical protein
MYAYTVPAIMRLANDECDDSELIRDSRTGIVLYFVVAGGLGLLAFLGWLVTL